MELLLSALTFGVVFLGVLVVGRRAPRAVMRLERHQIAGLGGPAVAALPPRLPLFGSTSPAASVGALAAKVTRQEVKTKAGKLLLEAGNPMPLATYLLLRMIFMFALAPLFTFYILTGFGISLNSIIIVAVGLLVLPLAPVVYVRGKARRRAREIEHALPDALDLLVVCVEGGLSLDGALLQVAQRTSGVLAAELRRLQSDMAAGMARRDAFQSLAARSQSESLKIFCATMIQADKVGMSIAATLRTLAETMRTRRRQYAETQARKAPLKMIPCLVFFMMPSLFVVILTPAVLRIVGVFGGVN